MADLLGLGWLVHAVNWLYWLLAIGAVWLAWRIPKQRSTKIAATGLIAIVFLVLPGSRLYQGLAHEKRYEKAKALFDERCKTAGEKIYRTVEGVDGVILANVRPSAISRDDQFERYDPYGYEGGGDEYIKSFLAGNWKTCVGSSAQCPLAKRAFDFVDVPTADSSYKEYSTIDKVTKKPFIPGVISIPELQEKTIGESQARYTVSWSDVSTDEDRKNWIAGGRITIVDRTTNQTIAERTGYYMDSGFGGTEGARSPWSWARLYTKGCPSVDEHNFIFVRKILKPVQGE